MQPISSWKLAVPLGMIRAFIMSTAVLMLQRQTPKNQNITFPPIITLGGSSLGHASKFTLWDNWQGYYVCLQKRI